MYSVAKNTFKPLFKFDLPSGQKSWIGAKFVCPRSILLYTSQGHADLYYLGKESDVKIASGTDANAMAPDDVVLFSEEARIFAVSRKDFAGDFTNQP